MQISVSHYDAFSTEAGKGNPAGVVFHPDGLTDPQMQAIAHAVGFSETAFVLRSEMADLRLRFFTPGHEVELCGHATVASLFGLYTQGKFALGEFILETKAGPLAMNITEGSDGVVVWMTQPGARFVPFEGDAAAVADVLGLTADDLAEGLPLVYGNTGLWTLIVPVRGLDAMRRMRPDTARFPKVLAQMPKVSIHAMCVETIDTAADMHGRHFSPPASGTVEDPVTGTASGVMGAYYAKYVAKRDGEFSLIVEQGQEVGRDGRVRVEVSADSNTFHVKIAGTAVFVTEMSVEV